MLTQLLGLANGGHQLLLILEVELEAVADLAVAGGGLEEHGLAVLGAIAGHAPYLASVVTKLFNLGGETRHVGGDLLRHLRRQRLGPVAAVLVSTGDELAGAILQHAVLNVIRAADEPLVNESVLGARRTDDGVNVILGDAFRQNGGLGAIERFVQVLVRNFHHLIGEAHYLGVAGLLPLAVLRGVALATLLGAHIVIGQVEDGFHAQAIGHGHLLVVVLLGVLLAAAKIYELFLAVADGVLADEPAFLFVLEDGMRAEQQLVEILLLLNVAFQGARLLRFLIGGLSCGVGCDWLCGLRGWLGLRLCGGLRERNRAQDREQYARGKATR